VKGKHPVWCHAGYAVVMNYYLSWWKSGKVPTPVSDSLVIFHLTQLAASGSAPFPLGEYTPDKAEDIVYVTAILRDGAQITVESGSLAPVEFNADAGISHWRTKAGPGPQRYSLKRNGNVVIDRISARRIEAAPSALWSWSYYSEVASA